MMYERYKAEFESLRGVAYKLIISQDSQTPYTVKEVRLSSDPISITWDDSEKTDTIQGSQAVIHLISQSDREFTDLYNVVAGSVRLDVYRNGRKYWSGTLDPELYEEPYSQDSKYVVSVSFSDLSILDRSNWRTRGFLSLDQILKECVSEAKISYSGIIYYISTRINSASDYLPDKVSLNCENFFDETGEAMSRRDVLDNVLKPFSLKMVQRDSYIYVYDLNYMCGLPVTELVWMSNDSSLSVDKVYSNVKVSFSPFGESSLFSASIDHDSISSDPSQVIKVYTNVEDDRNVYDGFKLWLDDDAKGGIIKGDKTKFFRIDPVYSGSECAGVAWTVKTYVAGAYVSKLNDATNVIGSSTILTMPETPFVACSGARSYEEIVIKMEMMLDVRKNPFEPGDAWNEEDRYKWLKENANIAWVPFMLTLKDSQGNAICHWDNKQVCSSSGFDKAGSKWVAGPGKFGDAYLCYYNDDRKADTGLGEWKSNRPAIGMYTGTLPGIYSRIDQGEHIPVPTSSGFLELKIGSGVKLWGSKNQNVSTNLTAYTNWLLYKAPEAHIADYTGKKGPDEDVEVSAHINSNAKDDYQVDTIIGTLDMPSMTAKGQIYDSDTKQVISRFMRNGVTDSIERLMIGTIYSNHSGAKNRLSGTVKLIPGLCVVSDEASPGQKYIVSGEEQDLWAETSSITAVEIAADNYKGVDYDE